MIRTTLAVSTLVLLAGCADTQHGTYARSDAGVYTGENRSVNNWGTAAPRVRPNEWNRPATTTVGPNGIERNDQSDRTWTNNNDDNRNYNSSSGTHSNNSQNNDSNESRSSNSWTTTNEPNRTDTGMNRSDKQYDHNRSAHSSTPNYNNENQRTGQNYTNDNTRRDNMRVTTSQGDNQFGQNNASAATIDAYFGKCVAGMNRFDIEAGELAIQRTKNEQVKNFAQMMVNEHKKAQSDLENVLRQNNWNASSQHSATHTDMLNHLRQLEGQQFDSEYMSAMAACHAMAVSMFKDKAQTLNNSELRSWTERQIPALEKHLDTARSINDRVRPR